MLIVHQEHHYTHHIGPDRNIQIQDCPSYTSLQNPLSMCLVDDQGSYMEYVLFLFDEFNLI